MTTFSVHMQGLRKQAYTTEIQLSADGSDLRKKVAHKCNLPIDQIKLITCGRVIKDNASLQEQSVKVPILYVKSAVNMVQDTFPIIFVISISKKFIKVRVDMQISPGY